MDKYYWCGICGKKKATSGSVGCTVCQNYVHLKCTKVTYKEAKKSGNNFVCIVCKSVEQSSGKPVEQDDVAQSSSTAVLSPNSPVLKFDRVASYTLINQSFVDFNIIQISEENTFDDSSDEEVIDYPLKSITKVSSVKHQNKSSGVLAVVSGENRPLYHLYVKMTKLFLAELIPESLDTVVHGHKLKEGKGKFLLKSVYLRSAIKWERYEADVHGSYLGQPVRHWT